MRRVLITGITGQDGGYLAERLLAEGDEVHGMVHSGDDAAVVFQSALQLHERTGRRVAVVQASSSEIFGDAAGSPQDEETPVRPVSPYGAAKAYAHQMARVYRSRGLHVSSCIFFNHESPRRPPTFVTRKITSAAARIGLTGTGVLNLGNLDARRDWGWAPDYVDAMVRAARHESPDDFVATGTSHSVSDFVRSAFPRVGIEDLPAHLETDEAFVRPVDAPELVGNATKARREPQLRPTLSFEEIVDRRVDHDLATRGEGG